MKEFHSSLAELKPESLWNIQPNPISFPLKAASGTAWIPDFPMESKTWNKVSKDEFSWIVPKENPEFILENRDGGVGPQSQFPGKAGLGL